MSDDASMAVESPPAVEYPPKPKKRRRKCPAARPAEAAATLRGHLVQ